MLSDLRFAFRALAKSPGFTTVAVLSLALGIGAGTAIFSLVNAILLSSLPVANPHELRVLRWTGTNSTINSMSGTWDDDRATKRITADAFSFPIFLSTRQQCAEKAELFAFSDLGGLTVRAKHEAFVADGMFVSDNFFSALGVRPELGRLLEADDNRADASPAIVICHGWWEREFGRDPGALGETVSLNGKHFTIIGVLPAEFTGISGGQQKEFYAPFSAQLHLQGKSHLTTADRWWVQLAARLKPGVDDAQVQAALDLAFAHEAERFVKQPKVLIEDGRGGTNYERSFYRKPLLLLLGVVGVVIVAACANLAGLSLARAAANQHDYAVRAAIGASRLRLMRHSLCENLLIAFFGAILGLALARWGKTFVALLLVGNRSMHSDPRLDLRVLAFAIALAVLTALLSGLLPALRAAWIDPIDGLRARTTLGAPKLRGVKLLVALQVSLSLILLSGAGLFVRSLVNLVRINPGFATEDLLLVRLNPASAGYRGTAVADFYSRVHAELASIPGVRGVALSQFALLQGAGSSGPFFSVVGASQDAGKPAAFRLVVSETFFTTMEIPILHGRPFSAADASGAPKVVVVNDAFVRKYIAGENAVGRLLHIGEDDWQIVGVCADAKYTSIRTPAAPTVYFSFRQQTTGSAYFEIRTKLPAAASMPSMRRVIGGIDPNVPLTGITTQAQVRDDSIRQEHMFATLCGALALLAAMLSCIGLYGLTPFHVARRTSEIGIRMALGATRRQISRPVLSGAMQMTSLGIVGGVFAALALTKIVESTLYGVAPRDPLSLAGAAVLQAVVTLIAAWIPARRASRVDPMIALRTD